MASMEIERTLQQQICEILSFLIGIVDRLTHLAVGSGHVAGLPLLAVSGPNGLDNGGDVDLVLAPYSCCCFCGGER